MSNLTKIKRLFAEAWLREPKNPFAAAMSICGGDASVAMQMSQAFVHDAEVSKLKTELIAQRGEEAFLPSKAEMFGEVWHRAKESQRDDDFVKLAKLAADIRGFLNKEVANQTNIVNNRVLVLPAPKSEDDWEKGCIEQQQALVNK